MGVADEGLENAVPRVEDAKVEVVFVKIAPALLEGLKVLVVVLGNPSAPPTDDIVGAGVDVLFVNRGLSLLEELKEVVVLLGG